MVGLKFSFAKLKNSEVYLFGEEEPFGIFSDAVIDSKGVAVGFVAKTLSLVPVSRAFGLEAIEKLLDKKIFLKKDAGVMNMDKFKKTSDGALLFATRLKSAKTEDMGMKKLKDLRFDFETGQICDLVVLKNIISGKEDISVNKIFADENTIYIKKRGGDKNV